MSRSLLRLLLTTAIAAAACVDRPGPTDTGARLSRLAPDTAGDTTGGRRPSRIATIFLSPSGDTTAVGDSAGFFAQALDADGHPVPSRHIRWSVADPAVAEIEAEFGPSVILRALQPGATTVTAASQGKTGSAFLFVVDSLPPPPDTGSVATVTVTPPFDSVAVGDSATFFATLRDSLGNEIVGPAVFWTVSDSTVAQITFVFGQTVLLRALAPGIATVTAFSQGKSGSGTLLVQ